ncbi:YCH1 [Acrasis kona]|uniref:YCH1 n=1 Tax=Acrasis kona TaxID=1008807 RepID=A0AAW2Z9K2_9EUKA
MKGVPYIDQESVRDMILSGNIPTSTTIVDVRGDHACDGDVSGRHIMHSVNISKFDKNKALSLAQKLTSENKSRVVFHCYYSNFRGPKASKIFLEVMSKNFANYKIEIRVLKGGWSSWKNSYKDDNKLTHLSNKSSSEESDEDEEQLAMIKDQVVDN